MDAEYFEQMKPRFLKPNEVEKPDANDPYPSVPSELKALPQWVMWKAEVRNAKPTKIPKQVTGENAKTDTLATWTDYQAVCEALRTGKFDGIGFVFTAEDKYTGIDLDDCIIDGVVQPWAKEIIGKFQSSAYMEVSPRKHGIKMWTRAKLPAEAKHKVYLQGNTGAAIEAYDRGRYFTVTGKGKYAIGDGQEAVNWLFEKYLKPEPQLTPTPKTTPPATRSRTEAEIIRLIEGSEQDAKFKAFMAGDFQKHGSHSEADLALIGVMTFWTQDALILDSIFRKSALYRPKWDEKHRADGATYGEMTIEKALAQPRETYTPPKTKKRRKRRDTFYEARAKRRRNGKQRRDTFYEARAKRRRYR